MNTQNNDDPLVVEGRSVVANGRSPAVTIPQEIAQAIGMEPGQTCRLVLQQDGTLLIQRTMENRTARSRSLVVLNSHPRTDRHLSKRADVAPMVVQEKKVVRNGKSPAVTINQHIGDVIDLRVGSPVRFTLYSDGSILVELCKVVSTATSTVIVPVHLDLSAKALPYTPVIPSDRVIRKRERPIEPMKAIG